WKKREEKRKPVAGAVKPNRRLLVFSVFIRKPSTLSSLLEHQADPIVFVGEADVGYPILEGS
ncbi:hypothetical protein QQP08_014253, partial [Theobroma cacao]